MKIAIHHRPGSFSERWIAYCDKKNIPYKIVSAFDNDIVNQLHDCFALMWHHRQDVYKDVITAKKILFALEHAGIKVFPNFKTGWHFDDKVAQKYLLEAIGAPLVPSYVFYEKQEAIDWARRTNYPKVFKLKGGAASLNVRLVRSEGEALKLINKAFGTGFPQYGRFTLLKEYFRKFKEKQESFVYVLKGLARVFIIPEFAKKQPNEKEYVYFQSFIAGNTCDIRVVVIEGEYAAAERRSVRDGDFRASGSGVFDYENIPEEAVRVAFKVAQELNLSSVAFDFIKNSNDHYLIVEMSYGFATVGISKVPGYWDKEMNWHEGTFTPQEWMVDELLSMHQERVT